MTLHLARRAVRGLLATRPRPAILMYHRVLRAEAGAPGGDPWGMAVSSRRFAEHVDFLARRRTVLGLADFVDAYVGGRLPNDAVAISFDDGYLDNILNAEPILAAAGLPATLFVISGAVGRPVRSGGTSLRA